MSAGAAVPNLSRIDHDTGVSQSHWGSRAGKVVSRFAQNIKPRRREPKGPPELFQAHNLHCNGRECGQLLIYAAELGGLLLLTAGGGWGLMVIAGLAYAEAAHHNGKVHHRVRVGQTIIENVARYADMRRVYGTIYQDGQGPESFKIYKEGRSRKSYWIRGLVGAALCRGVVFGAISHIPDRLRGMAKKAEYHLTPNDPLRRGRKRTDVGILGLPKKKDKPTPR